MLWAYNCLPALTRPWVQCPLPPRYRPPRPLPCPSSGGSWYVFYLACVSFCPYSYLTWPILCSGGPQTKTEGLSLSCMSQPNKITNCNSKKMTPALVGGLNVTVTFSPPSICEWTKSFWTHHYIVQKGTWTKRFWDPVSLGLTMQVKLSLGPKVGDLNIKAW